MKINQLHQRIIDLLARHPNDGLSGAEISLILQVGSAGLYPALIDLEDAGRLTSAWGEPPRPDAARPRIYRLAPGGR